jgi:hypothetical protein
MRTHEAAARSCHQIGTDVGFGSWFLRLFHIELGRHTFCEVRHSGSGVEEETDQAVAPGSEINHETSFPILFQPGHASDRTSRGRTRSVGFKECHEIFQRGAGIQVNENGFMGLDSAIDESDSLWPCPKRLLDVKAKIERANHGVGMVIVRATTSSLVI